MGVQPQSETDICNLALDHLNQGPITSIENPTGKISGLCARWYDQTRRGVLRSHTWNCAKKRTSLAALAEAPSYEFNTQYALPSDFLRVVTIGNPSDVIYKLYSIESGNLLVNSGGGALPFSYIYNMTNIEDMDPLLVEALAAALARNIAYPITGSNSTVQRMQAILEDILDNAKVVDGQEQPPRRYERSRFKESRRRVSTYGSKYLDDYYD